MGVRTSGRFVNELKTGRSFGGTLAIVLSLTGMILALIFFLLPLYWVVVASTKSDSQLFSTYGLQPIFPLQIVGNLSRLFSAENAIFPRWFLNSVIYGCAVGIGATLVSAMTGYAFAKFRFPLRGFWFAVVLGTITVPFTALVLPIYLLMHDLHLINTYWGVILPSLFNPFGIYLMRVFWTQGFPSELIEAGYMDGATDWYIFARLGLPIVRGGLATVGLFTFVGMWNNFFLPLVIISKNALYPLTLGLTVWNSATESGRGLPYSIIVSGALLSILPLALAYLFLQRYWRAGLTAGSSK
jgi:multiple sugar transport system permease protein